MTIQGMLYGMYTIGISKLNCDGYPVGQVADPNNIAGGTTSSMYISSKTVELTQAAPTYATAENVSGGKNNGSSTVGVESFGIPTVTFNEIDSTFHGLVANSTTTSAVVSGWTQTHANVNNTQPDRFLVVIYQKIQSPDNNNCDLYIHQIYNNIQFQWQDVGANNTGSANPVPNVYNMVVSQNSRTAIGIPYLTAYPSVSGGRDIKEFIQSDKPIQWTTYVEADTPSNTFTLPYQSATDQTDTSDKFISVDGTASTFTTLDPVTGVVTTTDVTAGQIVVAAVEMADPPFTPV